jgi:hypothetical protein
MAHLTWTQLKSFADRLHAQIEVMFDTCGSEEFESGTVLGKLNTAANYGTTNWTAGELQYLLKYIHRAYHHMHYKQFAALALPVLRAIDDHFRRWGESGINAFLNSQDERVGYWLRDTKFPFDPENVFPPEDVDHGATWNNADPWMSKWEYTGGAEDYTTGSDIDITKYGKANLILYCVTQAIYLSSKTFYVTCKKFDQTTEIKTVTITPWETDSSEPIGTPGDDMYVGVTLIEEDTSGANGMVCKVISDLERSTSM